MIAFLFACSKEPQPIDYGKDACNFCKMTIVDPIHGAELITTTGKIYKFDATECLVHFTNAMEKEKPEIFLTNHISNPKELTSVNEVSFLVSEELPSPMGENITAFPNTEKGQEELQKYEGQVYSWQELIHHLSSK